MYQSDKRRHAWKAAAKRFRLQRDSARRQRDSMCIELLDPLEYKAAYLEERKVSIALRREVSAPTKRSCADIVRREDAERALKKVCARLQEAEAFMIRSARDGSLVATRPDDKRRRLGDAFDPMCAHGVALGQLAEMFGVERRAPAETCEEVRERLIQELSYSPTTLPCRICAKHVTVDNSEPVGCGGRVCVDHDPEQKAGM